MSLSSLELISEHRCHGGAQRFYRHHSATIGLPMRFSVYLPPAAIEGAACPALYYLAGLTCTEETFMIKAAAQRLAARAGLILIAPDTSPRGAGLEGETDNWDFGVGAGFYLDATEDPWKRHYRMYSYIVDELYELVTNAFALRDGAVGIMGHSMGGHGALVIGLRNPDRFRSLSAFAPISAPMQCPWGQKAFSGYLGGDKRAWSDYDATEIVSRRQSVAFPSGILIDQGMADQFLSEQLHPHLFRQACETAGQPLILREHEGYDHGYYFISTFMEDHISHHVGQLNAD